MSHRLMDERITRKLLETIYDNYYARSGNLVRPIHRWLCRNKFLTEFIFGCKIYRIPHLSPTYTTNFDLTTLLLKSTLKNYLDKIERKKVLEIGTGIYGILSVYCDRVFNVEMHAIDIEDNIIKNCMRNIELNRSRIKLFKSNIFNNVDVDDFDIIFWNLPYYEEETTYLKPLLDQAQDYLRKGGRLILGYNGVPLDEGTVINYVNRNRSLIYEKGIKRIWNKHVISVIRKC